MDEAPPRKKRTFPIHYRLVSDSRFGPQRLELLTDEERDAKLAADARVAAQKLAAANAAADAAAVSSATSPDQPLPAPPLPPEQPPSSPAPLAPSDPSAPPDFSRHPRRCTICCHPDRDAIEGDFIRWRNPEQIAKAFNITDRVSVYRHAHYAGLFQRRKRQVALVLESFLESAESCPIEAADMIIRATRLYVRINEHGEWVEAPRTQYFITGTMDSTEPSATSPTPSPTQASAEPSDPAPPKPAERRRNAIKPDPTSPKPNRRKRNPKILTATHPNSEIS
jgi:hypothetical protein